MNELLTRMSITLDALRTELYYAENSGDAAGAATARAQYDETAARFRVELDAASAALLERLAT